ncbi:hypothetical protein DPMN_175183 [Dreissena polymorpha]|uniref:Uncharacterized protein n=1 Tax=Dreissena polymorpha TaxID=45954 RepID=A0A9D4E627_DREPO|nr:hypothetical protein DPMN_175183 [Dreissena polymorpha]
MQIFSRTIYNKRLKYSKSCDNRGSTASPTDNHRLHSEAAVFNRLHVTIYNQMSHTLQPDVSSLHPDATSSPAKMSKMDTIRIRCPKSVTHSISL